MFRSDSAYRVRSAALVAYGQLKPGGGLAFLQQAARTESPDNVIRRAAVRAMGALGDNMAVATLDKWSAQGQPVDVRDAAISSLAQLDKKNAAIETQLLGYRGRSGSTFVFPRLFALGERGDPAAIAPLEAMLNRGDLPPGLAPYIQREIARLKRPGSGAGAGPS